MTTQPTVKWAQRKDRLFLTIDIQDITEENVVLTAEKVSITGKSGGKDYAVDIEFSKEVDPEDADSKWAKTGRNLQMQIMKKDKEEEEHWPFIQKDKVKRQWLQTDWSRFVDEDEEDEKPAEMDMGGAAQGFGGMGGPPGMGGMGGPPGMGGMGGPGGMDMASLMAQMGGGGGEGGPGGMDMSAMMAAMGGAGGGGPPGGMPGGMPGMEDDDSDDELPDLDDPDDDGDADDVD